MSNLCSDYHKRLYVTSRTKRYRRACEDGDRDQWTTLRFQTAALSSRRRLHDSPRHRHDSHPTSVCRTYGPYDRNSTYQQANSLSYRLAPILYQLGLIQSIWSDVPANQILRICTKTRDGDRPSQEWRRASGRPPTTWIHQIRRDTGVTATEGLQLAEDRSFWWTIATAGGFGWSLRITTTTTTTTNTE